jgi:molecular chaperone HtpG
VIRIPDYFESLLSTEPTLAQSVRKSFSEFEPWLEQSGMPFFPGFTDHSPRHINDVLKSAASLVADDSRPLLSASDVAVLCMAILLHDCGMHLTQDSFRALVEDSAPPMIPELGDLRWSRLWTEFCSEANRFSEEKLIAIFGDSEPCRTEALDLANLTERDCLLVGEFVRRHHARLAHEIGRGGVPSKNNNRLRLSGFDTDLADIAGLIARSHGIAIRRAFPYITTKYGLIAEYRKVKIPFLMAVLRIADYIQVQGERAIATLLSVKELRSPVSRQEWRVHFAVKGISNNHDDPEVLYVQAAPDDVATFLRLDALFKDIQREMDDSWATIGEVYGRRGELSKLGLTIRRIRSNLDSKAEFSKSVPYIPIQARFDASGPELLRLLVGPLYNYDIGVGIRELVQNAVDACRERSDVAPAAPSLPTDFDVLVHIREEDDGTGWITVTDHGVGMTLKTVVEYFLVAGASFRNSEIWRRQHLDEAGEARPIRGGRFGVGVLAAFLLGEEITVITRHFSEAEDQGLTFHTKIDEPNIEIRRCAAEIGTTIKVRVSNKQAMEKLRPDRMSDPSLTTSVQSLEEWPLADWFLQSTPRVVYRWDGIRAFVSQSNSQAVLRERVQAEFRPQASTLVPLLGGRDTAWHVLPDPSPYKAIYWRYLQEEKKQGGSFEYLVQPADVVSVNGIRVQLVDRFSRRSGNLIIPDERDSSPGFSVRRPSLAIFDPAAVCPINLQRNAISFDRMGTEGRIATAILRENLLRVSGAISERTGLEGLEKFCRELRKQRDIHFFGRVEPICCTRDGFAVAAPRLFAELEIDTLIFLPEGEVPPSLLQTDIRPNEAVLLRSGDTEPISYLKWYRGLWGSVVGYPYYSMEEGLPHVRPRAGFSVMSADMWDLANSKGKVAKYIRRLLRSESLNERQRLVSAGNSKYTDVLRSRILGLQATLNSPEIAGWSLDNLSVEDSPTSLLHSVWIDLFQGVHAR